MSYKHIKIVNGFLVAKEVNGNDFRTKLSAIDDFKETASGTVTLVTRTGTRYVVTKTVCDEVIHAQDEKKVTQ